MLLIALFGSGIGYWALSGLAAESGNTFETSLNAERLAADRRRNISNGVYRTTASAVSTDASLSQFCATLRTESTGSRANTRRSWAR